MLTKKDVAEIARIIRENTKNDSSYDFGWYIDPYDLVDDIVAFLSAQNPRFDAKKFREACEHA